MPIAIHLVSSNRLLKVAMMIPERSLTIEQAEAVCKTLNDMLEAEYAKEQKAQAAKDKANKKK
jgi:hypothetical protein